jgi:hypothetical protein
MLTKNFRIFSFFMLVTGIGGLGPRPKLLGFHMSGLVTCPSHTKEKVKWRAEKVGLLWHRQPQEERVHLSASLRCRHELTALKRQRIRGGGEWYTELIRVTGVRLVVPYLILVLWGSGKVVITVITWGEWSDSQDMIVPAPGWSLTIIGNCPDLFWRGWGSRSARLCHSLGVVLVPCHKDVITFVLPGTQRWLQNDCRENDSEPR